ncbi:MAG: DUF2029 domain-containing protein [Desulfobacterales bacterium]|nr:DUF2029 domain-containing protein [Desulfobacterales bacterium]
MNRIIGTLTKERKVELLAYIILIGFSLEVFFCYWNGSYQGLPYPYNTFLFWPSHKFGDYFHTFQAVEDLNPYLANKISVYYPFLNLAAYFFTLIPDIFQSYIVYSFSLAAIFIAINYYFLHSKDLVRSIAFVLIFTFLTYPVLFTFDRGNLEGLVFVFLLLFMFFFIREDYWISAVFLAFAISSKLYPAVFLLLFISKKKYKEFAFAIFMTAVLTLIALLSFEGGLANNIGYLINGENLKTRTFVMFTGNNNKVQRGVTLFTFIKILLIETGSIASVNMQNFLLVYMIIGFIGLLFLGAYTLCIEKVLWKKFAILTFAMLLIPQLSADYKLIHIFLPLFLFINKNDEKPLDIVYLILFGVLLIPKSYTFLTNTISDAGNDISTAVLLNPIIMVLICALIIGTGMQKWVKNRRTANAKDANTFNLRIE